jgi:Transposase IS4
LNLYPLHQNALRARGYVKKPPHKRHHEQRDVESSDCENWLKEDLINLTERRKHLRGRYLDMDVSGSEIESDVEYEPPAYIATKKTPQRNIKKDHRKAADDKFKIKPVRSCTKNSQEKQPSSNKHSKIQQKKRGPVSKMKQVLNILNSQPSFTSQSAISESESNSDIEFSQSGSESSITHSSDEEIEEINEGNETSGNLLEGEWFLPKVIKQSFPFTEPDQIQLDGLSKPEDFFELFLDDEVICLMVTETNLYAEQTISAQQSMAYSRFSNWVETDAPEMKKFIGLLIWMGLVNMPSMSCYWSRSTLYSNCISKTMSRNRFQLLLRMWHFANNEDDAPGDRLHKVRKLKTSMQEPTLLKNLNVGKMTMNIMAKMARFQQKQCLYHSWLLLTKKTRSGYLMYNTNQHSLLLTIYMSRYVEGKYSQKDIMLTSLVIDIFDKQIKRTVADTSCTAQMNLICY